ncbi:MAG TPA: condensation domain-containing protein [Asanoa sp.]|jgi:hypothetical protein|nr:condensation domain-containing protein [Asanoa sp.]
MNRPLSVGQEAMWFIHRLAPESAAYNVTLGVRVHAPLADDRLVRAVAAVEGRHDPLRSVIVEIDGKPVRRVLPAAAGGTLRLVEAPGAADDRVRELARRAAAEPFGLLAGDRPFRVVLVRSAPADALLVITAHHIAADAPSLFLILRDLLLAYRTDTSLPPLRLTFDDYVTRERQLLASGRAARMARHWSAVQAGATAARLPGDRLTPARPGYTGDTCPFHTAPGFAPRLRRAAAALGVTPFAYLLGAFQAMLHRSTGESDLLIGTAVALRGLPGLRDTVGYMVNTVPLRASFDPGDTLVHAVTAANEQVRQGLAYAGYPYPLMDRPGTDRTPLFRITFTMIAVDRMPVSLPPVPAGAAEGPVSDHGGLPVSYVELPQQEGQFDLSVELRAGDTALSGVFRYDNEILDRATVEDLADRFVRFADRAVATPQARVADLPLLDAAGLDRLLAFGGVG